MLEKMQNSKKIEEFGLAACAGGTEADDSFVVYSSNAHDRLHVAIALHSTISNTVLWQKNNIHSEVFLLMCLMMDMSQLLLLGKFEYGGGPIFKVVLEC